jgi:hypothetical protein
LESELLRSFSSGSTHRDWEQMTVF